MKKILVKIFSLCILLVLSFLVLDIFGKTFDAENTKAEFFVEVEVSSAKDTIQVEEDVVFIREEEEVFEKYIFNEEEEELGERGFFPSREYPSCAGLAILKDSLLGNYRYILKVYSLIKEEEDEEVIKLGHEQIGVTVARQIERIEREIEYMEKDLDLSGINCTK